MSDYFNKRRIAHDGQIISEQDVFSEMLERIRLLELNQGSGSGVFENDIEVVGTTLGPYTNGETIPSEGLTAEEVINLLATDYLTPTFSSFGFSLSSPVEVGTTISSGAKTATWGTTNSSNIVANSVDIDDTTASVNLITGTANDGSQSVDFPTSITKTTATSHTWTISAENSLGGSLSRTSTVTWQYRKFFSPVSSTPANSAAVRALTSSFYTSGQSFTLTTGTTQKKFSVNLPPGVTIVSVTDTGNLNLDITSEYVLLGTISVNDADGNPLTYNQYEMNTASAYPVSTSHVFVLS